MHTKLIALDLDRTLFDTERFADHLAHISAQMLAIPYKTFMADMEHHRVGKASGLQYYDYFAHMAAMGKPIDSAVRSTLMQGLQATQTSYLYSDVTEVLEVLQQDHIGIFILSYGEMQYQNLKYDISPQLHALELQITMQDKSQWLAERYPEPNMGVLVDDKNIYQELPPNWRLCHLQREKGERFDCTRILKYLHDVS